jgi:photosystem II stability/assembly factor-like uncharacterized protein
MAVIYSIVKKIATFKCNKIKLLFKQVYMKHLLKTLFACYLLSGSVYGQTIKILYSDSSTSIRGLSVVDDKTIWVSGNHGMIGKSDDAGQTWAWVQVKGFTENDFRDIEAFDESHALIMGIGEPAYILRTINGGAAWSVVFENKTKGMFLDAMEFWNEQSGIVIGDPVNNKFFIARTFDGGRTWRGIPEQNFPVADSGEACFAASGTNIRKLNKAEACFVSGGTKSRLFIRDRKIAIPFAKGSETLGANSVAVKDGKTLIVVGGDYTMKDSAVNNCFITRDEGITWTTPSIPPHGYRSCVEYLDNNKWICCGPNGVDYTKDNGKTWVLISNESFNVCRKAKDGNTVFLAGDSGKIGELIF